MDPKNKKEPPHTVVNGRKRYRLSAMDGAMCIAESHFRKRPEATTAEKPAEVPAVANQADAIPEGTPPAEGPAEEPQPETSANTDEVRTFVRVLSAVPTWSSMGWLGAQLVLNDWNNAYALRKMAGFITQRQTAKPVPFVWDHSFSMRDKAGHLEDGLWEDSTDMPPGVNCDAVVRRSYDEKAASGLEHGEIDAMSVAWDPDFEQSHPELDFWTFIEMQGHEVDGRTVAWLPVDLDAKGVLHLGMVWAGADENAGPRANANASNNSVVQSRSEHGIANAANDNQPERGGSYIMDKLIAFYQAILGVLGIEHVLDEKSPPPDALNDRVMKKLKDLVDLRNLYNSLATKLQALENQLLTAGETSLDLNGIVDRLPKALDMAKWGEAYVADLRAQALKWFNSSKVNPEKKELSADELQIRSVIEGCTDIGQLKAYIAEYQAQAEARFGPQKDHRTSSGDEPEPGTPNALSPEQKRAIASAKRWELGGKE